MYQPSHNQFIENRANELHKLIREYPLGTLVTQSELGANANHVPFLFDAESGKLTAHVPRANLVWQEIDRQSVLVIFHGPQSYISPSWYASKRAHGKVVPTWNYAVVHARGSARAIEDQAWLRTHLEELTTTQERHLEHPWKVSDAPADYVDKLLGAIVGLEIVVTALEGKFKLGQSKSTEDQQSVVEALQDRQPVLARMTRDCLKS